MVLQETLPSDRQKIYNKVNFADDFLKSLFELLHYNEHI